MAEVKTRAKAPARSASRTAGGPNASATVSPQAEAQLPPPAPSAIQQPLAAASVPAPAVVEPASLAAPKPVSVAAPLPAPNKPVAAPAAPAGASPAAFATIKKGLFAMTDATAFTAGTEKAQAMFGDLNARAKTAAEKGARFVEEFTELTKGNVEALVTSGKIAAKGAEAIGAEYAAYGKSSFEKASGALKSFTAIKSPTDLLQIQSEFAKSSFDAMVAESSKLTETFVKLAGEVMQPISSRFAVAAEKVKSAAL